MSLRKALLAATVLALPVAAQAQPVSGIYIAGGVGVNWALDSDISTQGALRTALGNLGVGTVGQASFEAGWVGLASIGYGFGNGVRAEIEGNYRSNGVNGISGFNGISAPRSQGGDVLTYGVMANVFYDFDLGPGAFLVPYIGAGIGYAVTDYDNVKINSLATGRQLTLSGDEGQFAWQFIVGAAFPIASVPGLSITAEGRYFATLDTEVNAIYTAPSGAITRQNGAVEVSNSNVSLLIGVRYAFGVTPPPPPVAAAPAPARTFLVFFDWNRDNLTDRARQIIAEAAQSAQRVGTTRIEVAGHADTSGNAQYNQRLSERRANNVAAELARLGVPRSAMVVQGFGETRPLVPTGDNVREPQNRRVEIVLR
jgi:outer membrane protein OmpA-like peptidoglycan-associated protein